jgi:hypothetical protein
MMQFGLKTKKAMTWSVLLEIIVVIIVAIILISAGYKMTISSKKTSDDKKCMLSILAAHHAANLRETSQDAVDIVPNLECKAKDVVIKIRDVEHVRGGNIDDDKIKRIFASEMTRCWSLVGAGKLNPYESQWEELGVNDQTYCLICAIINIDPELRGKAEEEGYELLNFNYWMAKENMPGTKKKYLEYLSSRERPFTAEQLTEFRNSQEMLPLDDTYYVIWRLHKPIGAIDIVFSQVQQAIWLQRDLTGEVCQRITN